MSHAHVKLSGSCNLDREVMKSAPAGAWIKGRLIGTIANQIVASLLSQDPTNPATQIISILDRHTPGFVRQVIKPFLRFKRYGTAVLHRILHLLRISSGKIIGSSRH